jgi:hypothetical protein
MILENDFKLCFAQRDKLSTELKLKKEVLASKEEEIKFLKEKMKDEDNSDKQKNFDAFQKEIQIIRDKLIAKTYDLLKLEDHHNKTIELNKTKVNEINEAHNALVEENNKLKSIITNILTTFKKGNDDDVKKMLADLSENTPIDNKPTNNSLISPAAFSEDNFKKDPDISNILQNKSYDAITNNPFEMDIDGGIKLTDNDEFTQKVITEFDKVFNDEFKRVKRYFDKSEPSKSKRKSSAFNAHERKGSSGKNYVNWVAQTANSKWIESLRGNDNNYKANRDTSVDIDDLMNTSKTRIRSSMRSANLSNISNISLSMERSIGQVSPIKNRKSNGDDSFLKLVLDGNDNLAKNYENELNKNHSPHLKDNNIKKIIKKEESSRR